MEPGDQYEIQDLRYERCTSGAARRIAHSLGGGHASQRLTITGYGLLQLDRALRGYQRWLRLRHFGLVGRAHCVSQAISDYWVLISNVSDGGCGPRGRTGPRVVSRTMRDRKRPAWP